VVPAPTPTPTPTPTPGVTPTPTSTPLPTATPTPAVPQGDYNGDGNLDLFWRHETTGEKFVWFMNGVTLVSTAGPTAEPDTNWRIGAQADLNSDGKTDLVWRNYATGTNYIWLMNGTTLRHRRELLLVHEWHNVRFRYRYHDRGRHRLEHRPVGLLDRPS
jgi:hypothetical protein